MRHALRVLTTLPASPSAGGGSPAGWRPSRSSGC
ncbi:hypothetical protein BH20ACT9_BH20ACT9_09550 [soil metagenome]